LNAGAAAGSISSTQMIGAAGFEASEVGISCVPSMSSVRRLKFSFCDLIRGARSGIIYSVIV
jgi:hypothetical protein